MRVAYVCTDPGVPVFGSKGASVHVQAVLRALVGRGHEVHLVASRLGGEVPDDLDTVRVHRLPVASGRGAERERALQAADAAVGAVLDRLADGVPLDLVYERYALWGRTATSWSRRHSTSSVLEVNAPLVEEQVRHRELVDRTGAEAVARSALSCASLVVCVSDGVAAWARARSQHPGAVHVVPNGVDAQRIAPASRPATPAAATPFVTGFVGTLKPWHGVTTLIDALAVLHRDEPGAHRLLLVGDGPERADVLARATRLGVRHLVEDTGPVAPAEVAAHLRRMDVGAAPYPPSSDFYFSPLKVLEYLAAGLPVVASRIGQIPDLLDGGALGSLVEPGSAQELASAVAELRRDEVRRRALRTVTRDAVLQRHTWDRVVDRVLALSSARPVAV